VDVEGELEGVQHAGRAEAGGLPALAAGDHMVDHRGWRRRPPDERFGWRTRQAGDPGDTGRAAILASQTSAQPIRCKGGSYLWLDRHSSRHAATLANHGNHQGPHLRVHLRGGWIQHGQVRYLGLQWYSSTSVQGALPTDISFLQVMLSGSRRSQIRRSRTGGSPIVSKVRRSPSIHPRMMSAWA
jgi:hypothetical protein